jgi:hypothetical protein
MDRDPSRFAQDDSRNNEVHRDIPVHLVGVPNNRTSKGKGEMRGFFASLRMTPEWAEVMLDVVD